MSPADDNTGSPPAVTFERLEQWREIAAAVDSALNMGGEPGMDLLVSRMAEWNEAIDEWTSALQTCLELGSRGLRDEAGQWHADGFLEVGDSLHAPTKRAGWDDWRAALEEREIPLPQFDLELRNAVHGMAEELATRDITGRSLAGQIAGLRRNVLIRGGLGERLTLLDSIRGLDPGREVWTDMIAPIRRQRAEQLEADIRTAVGARDFAKLARLVEEAETVNWEGQLDGRVVALVNAVKHLTRSRGLLHALGESAAQARMRCQELRNQPINLPSFSAALRTALQARQTYVATRQQLTQSLQHAASVQETKALSAGLRILDQGRQVDASMKPDLEWLGQQEQFEKVRLQFCRLEDEVQKLMERAPQLGGSWDDFKQKAVKWGQAAGELRIAANRLRSSTPDLVPPSTAVHLADLEAGARRVKQDYDRVVFWEKVVIGSVIGGLLLVLLVIILVVAFASRGSSR